MVKNPPAMWDIWVRSLGWEDPLEKGMATLSSILAWRILWTEEPGELQSMGLQRVWHDWTTKHSKTFTYSRDEDVDISMGVEGWFICILEWGRSPLAQYTFCHLSLNLCSPFWALRRWRTMVEDEVGTEWILVLHDLTHTHTHTV